MNAEKKKGKEGILATFYGSAIIKKARSWREPEIIEYRMCYFSTGAQKWIIAEDSNVHEQISC